MAYVVSVSINGLNGRREPMSFNLNRDVNVFFGLNGSGKTSVLRIIDSAMSNNVSLIADLEFSYAEVVVYSDNYKKNFKHTVKKSNDSREAPYVITSSGDKIFIHDPMSRQKNWSIYPGIKKGDDGSNTSWSHSYLSTNRLYTLGRVQARQNTISEKELNASFANSVQSVWGRQFGDIKKKVSDIQEQGLQKVLTEVLSKKFSEDGTRNVVGPYAERAYERMSSFLKRQVGSQLNQALGEKQEFLARYETDSQLRNIVRHIDEVESQIDAEMQPIKILAELVESIFSQGKKVAFDGPTIRVTSDHGDDIGIEKLSSGEKHLINILVSAMEIEESTLIIDEPEISMHIDWQKDLVRYIRALNPKCQLICATHSPEIMAKIEDEKIFQI